MDFFDGLHPQCNDSIDVDDSDVDIGHICGIALGQGVSSCWLWCRVCRDGAIVTVGVARPFAEALAAVTVGLQESLHCQRGSRMPDVSAPAKEEQYIALCAGFMQKR